MARKWIFEPHNGYGTRDPDGEMWPFGYFSLTEPIDPIFELGDVGLRREPGELRRHAEAFVEAANNHHTFRVALHHILDACDTSVSDPAVSGGWRRPLPDVATIKNIEKIAQDAIDASEPQATSGALNDPVKTAAERALLKAAKALEAIATTRGNWNYAAFAADELADIRILVPKIDE